jgi:hypothetical protein
MRRVETVELIKFRTWIAVRAMECCDHIELHRRAAFSVLTIIQMDADHEYRCLTARTEEIA